MPIQKFEYNPKKLFTECSRITEINLQFQRSIAPKLIKFNLHLFAISETKCSTYGEILRFVLYILDAFSENNPLKIDFIGFNTEFKAIMFQFLLPNKFHL